MDYVPDPFKTKKISMQLKVWNPCEENDAIYNYAFFTFLPTGSTPAQDLPEIKILDSIGPILPEMPPILEHQYKGSDNHSEQP